MCLLRNTRKKLQVEESYQTSARVSRLYYYVFFVLMDALAKEKDAHIFVSLTPCGNLRARKDRVMSVPFVHCWFNSIKNGVPEPIP